jgi:hypothetical protein
MKPVSGSHTFIWCSNQTTIWCEINRKIAQILTPTNGDTLLTFCVQNEKTESKLVPRYAEFASRYATHFYVCFLHAFSWNNLWNRLARHLSINFSFSQDTQPNTDVMLRRCKKRGSWNVADMVCLRLLKP